MRKLLMLAAGLALAFGCDSSLSSNNEFGDARDECDRQCGDLNRGLDPCVSADILSECQDQCLRVSPQKAQQFADCVDSFFGEECATKAQCLSTLDIAYDTSSAQNFECRSSCDGIASRCPEVGTAGRTADCKAACDTESSSAIDTFVMCQQSNEIFCDEVETCYSHIGVF